VAPLKLSSSSFAIEPRAALRFHARRASLIDRIGPLAAERCSEPEQQCSSDQHKCRLDLAEYRASREEDRQARQNGDAQKDTARLTEERHADAFLDRRGDNGPSAIFQAFPLLLFEPLVASLDREKDHCSDQAEKRGPKDVPHAHFQPLFRDLAGAERSSISTHAGRA
jgi:hypothetical protein